MPLLAKLHLTLAAYTAQTHADSSSNAAEFQLSPHSQESRVVRTATV